MIDICITNEIQSLWGNQISNLPADIFDGLNNLQRLFLENNQISNLPADIFDGLNNLQILQLQNNSITNIEDGAFSPFASSLLILNLTYNNLKDYEEKTFKELVNLTEFYSDFFHLCCVVGDIEICEPTDAFASCQDLLKRKSLRVLMLVIGVSSIIGNALVLISRCCNKEKTVDSMLISSLAISDLLMAMYLLIIAGADIHYRGRYSEVLEYWKSSFTCSFAGAISTLSSECSVFTLMVMSVDRAVNIVSPFNTRRLSRKTCKIVIVIAWVVIAAISFLPVAANKLSFIDLPYFGQNYYGKQSVCLPLPLTRSHLPGWEYATAIFIAFNGFGFLVMVVSYLTIFFSVKRSSATVNRRKSFEEQLRIARKLVFIIGTDFCCWFPIILMGICSETKHWDIPAEIYVWAATFILPINSAVNPYLYTIIYTCSSEKTNR
ncbi:G-protein coupled receptor GRL101-like [Antedon mediterranea]|uniref:G-protein coupled receptor GRL101-like n=1 Tax=Antedon mediterranea TaxID=105859 RepID=UPI003AF6A460